jgi:hypothetical protein
MMTNEHKRVTDMLSIGLPANFVGETMDSKSYRFFVLFEKL